MDIIKARKAGYGGSRSGAGRPKPTRTKQRVDAITKMLKKYATEQGMTIHEVAAHMVYGIRDFPDIPVTVRLNAIEFLDRATQVTEGGEADKAPPGPAVYLPEMRPDEGKVVNLRESQEDQPRDPVWKEGAGWIGVDLDGTLAHQADEMDGSIGAPAEGKTVKIFTARWHRGPDEVSKIQDWCQAHGLPRLDVTASKNLNTIEVWDDHAVFR